MAGDADENSSTKRRRLQNSCDACRRKKVRCNSAEMPNNRCTNCITSGIACTHTRTKGPEGALTAERLKAAQSVVASAVSQSPAYVPPSTLSESNSALVEVCQYARTLEEKIADLEDKLRTATKPPDPPAPAPNHPGVAIEYHNPLVAGCVNIILDPFTGYKQSGTTYGKSSSADFIKRAIKHVHAGNVYIVGLQRADYWETPLWEKYTIAYPPLVFPDPDLIDSLVRIYFEQINPGKRHLAERAFGEVVLAVCACASKYSDDPRVFLEQATRDAEHSAGWMWFAQVRPTHAAFDAAQALLQLQRLVLCILYFAASSTPDECWFQVGVGLRFLQAVGAHTKSWYQNPAMDPLDAELYKRCFWMLILWESIMSTFKGRPSSMSMLFDAPLPTDLDDEFWSLPEAEIESRKQNVVVPLQPSVNAFLPAYLRLVSLYSKISSRVYPQGGRTPSDEDIIELDSAVNEWMDNTPNHLKWDPQQENQVFLDQSAMIYAAYYHAQILIHRPFITAPGKEVSSNTSFPSMAICANAARSIGHILETQARKGRGIVACPGVISMLFDSSVVLLINVWRLGARTGSTADDFNKATADVRNCLKVLRLYERRWRIAGRSCDIVAAMLNFSRRQSDLKRPRRDEDDSEAEGDSPPALSQNGSGSSTSTTASSPQTVDEQMEALERSIAETHHLFSNNLNGGTDDFTAGLTGRLPMSSNELGRLPIYTSFELEPPSTSASDVDEFAMLMQREIANGYGPGPFTAYQPQSHVHAQLDEVPGLLPPELVYQAQAESMFGPAPESVDRMMRSSITALQHVENPNPFEIPMSPYWDEWSSYLANIGGLQGQF
ncbi:hypothetical protein MKEN_00138400 [Mycena kentingensis (nom. inval.)]|nr:hypothetical protein MKEN_00138400 [Mycena kentingensis (nom. inval.)]